MSWRKATCAAASSAATAPAKGVCGQLSHHELAGRGMPHRQDDDVDMDVPTARYREEGPERLRDLGDRQLYKLKTDTTIYPLLDTRLTGRIDLTRLLEGWTTWRGWQALSNVAMSRLPC